jgi:hypothetical protein
MTKLAAGQRPRGIPRAPLRRGYYRKNILNDPITNPDSFREATQREHRIAAALFIGFGIFFAMLFMVWVDSWFRWVVLSLAVISVLYGLAHAIALRRGQ